MTFHLNKPGIDRSADQRVQLQQIISFLERMTQDLNYYMNQMEKEREEGEHGK